MGVASGERILDRARSPGEARLGKGRVPAYAESKAAKGARDVANEEARPGPVPRSLSLEKRAEQRRSLRKMTREEMGFRNLVGSVRVRAWVGVASGEAGLKPRDLWDGEMGARRAVEPNEQADSQGAWL